LFLLLNSAIRTASAQILGPLPPPLSVVPEQPRRAFSSSSSGPNFQDQVMARVNQERWNNGQLPPLKRNDLLDAAAIGHSVNMGVRNFFAHCDLDTGTSPWNRMVAAGYVYSYAAENIAAGYSTPTAVMTGWMNSSGHRANILSTNVREIGIGYSFDTTDAATVRLDQDGNCVADGFSGPYFHYWTQTFGSRQPVYPLVIERELYQTDNRFVDLYLYGTGWATQMRLRNENGNWTSWQPFTANVIDWQLSANNGLKQVFAELRDGGGTVLNASDTILLEGLITDTFIDVPQSHWAYVEIEALAAANLIEGCATDSFCPNDVVTRDRLAVWLGRVVRGATYTPITASGVFNDVPVSHWAANWIEQLTGDGLLTGCDAGLYCPGQVVTRAELAIALLRGKHGAGYSPPAATGTMFADVAADDFAAAWIEALASEVGLSGCGDGNYCPNGAVTRAEFAVLLVQSLL
jgi:uncharacterized protein YkwD